MHKHPKTVPKQPTQSSTLHQNSQTAQPSQKKHKSLKLPNHLYFQKGPKSYAFPVYTDEDIGIDPEHSRCVIELKMDEDCESSGSVIGYGVRLCERDLRDGVRDRQLGQGDGDGEEEGDQWD